MSDVEELPTVSDEKQRKTDSDMEDEDGSKKRESSYLSIPTTTTTPTKLSSSTAITPESTKRRRKTKYLTLSENTMEETSAFGGFAPQPGMRIKKMFSGAFFYGTVQEGEPVLVRVSPGDGDEHSKPYSRRKQHVWKVLFEDGDI